MANENPPSSSVSDTAHDPAIARLYRAHVQPQDRRGIERTAFVEASNHNAAVRKIAAAIAALEYCSTTESVCERVYNVASGIELVAEGLSTDPELRLFETGWGRSGISLSNILSFCSPIPRGCVASGRGSLKPLVPRIEWLSTREKFGISDIGSRW
jgi:hypothetical protein